MVRTAFSMPHKWSPARPEWQEFLRKCFWNIWTELQKKIIFFQKYVFLKIEFEGEFPMEIKPEIKYLIIWCYLKL